MIIGDGVILLLWGLGIGSGLLFLALGLGFEYLMISMGFVLLAVGSRFWNWIYWNFLGGKNS